MTRAARVALLLVWAARLGAGTAQAQQPSRPIAVWIDTDPAVGVPDRDVDDGFALLQAFHSPELQIRGVSVVFGNAPLAQAWPIGRRIVRQFGPAGLRVYRGAAGGSELGVETAASRALAAALAREPLVVIALGPATNVATVLKNRPELASRMVRIVAVAGRRPGQRFTTGTVNTNGHRDFNFEQDPDAFRAILASSVPLTLAGFEVSSKVWMTDDDLARLAQGPAGVRSMVAPARRWLGLWKRTFGVDGFNPFDTLAIARVVSPSMLTCEELPARIEARPDDVTEAQMQGTKVAEKPYLEVSPAYPPSRTVEYCSAADPAFKDDLLRRLVRASKRE
jgi:pyrimidine-specific ribonucleoside hydrolase